MASPLRLSNPKNMRQPTLGEVYVAATPLRAAKGPAQLLMSAAYSVNFWELQHFMLIIRSSSSVSLPPKVLVFDFQPQDPENLYVALRALSGTPVPGPRPKPNPALPKFIDYVSIHNDHYAGSSSPLISEEAQIDNYIRIILVRRMGKLPNKRCWQIGASRVDNPIEEAYEFNRGWNTDVLIGHRDCRHYVNGLAEVLTGEKQVLDRLRGITATT